MRSRKEKKLGGGSGGGGAGTDATVADGFAPLRPPLLPLGELHCKGTRYIHTPDGHCDY